MFSKRGSNDTIRNMTKPLNYHIVIDRKDLPEVVVTNHGNAYSFKLKDEVKNPTTRYKALEYLALDEAIKGHAAAVEAEKDEKKLRDEAGKLFEASRERMNKDGITCPAWEKLDAKNIAHWEYIARAARELHGK